MKVVVKIGTASLTNEETGFPKPEILGEISEAFSYMIKRGIKPVLVTSGAIGLGLKPLGFKKRPKTITLKQAAAAVGQGLLMHIYSQFFSLLDIKIAQILLTREDIINRERYINAQKTFETLLQKGIVPIVNENDVVAVEEIKFGDNDTLSAIVSTIIDADVLIILTTTDGVYTKDPTVHKDAKRIKVVKEFTKELLSYVTKTKTTLGVGGMETKIKAAEIATNVGVKVIIGSGKNPYKTIVGAIEGEDVGTLFFPKKKHLDSRKRWILYGLTPKGEIIIDEGAKEAIKDKGKSLLAAGIVDVKGNFMAGETVKVIDKNGNFVGQGIVKYSSGVLKTIKGKKTKEIERILGFLPFEEVIHRDDLSII